jgi:manganese/zinc/iron transport system permease protein
MNWLLDFFSDYTIRIVSIGSALIGAVSGMVGTFAFLRKQSLLGDTISHAALPGVVLAFLITGGRAPLALLIGAMIAGLLGSLMISLVVRRTRIKEDAALGIILSVFFGLGIALLSFSQRLPNAQKAGLETYIFGQAATIIASDVAVFFIVFILVSLGIAFFWKELKLFVFNPEYGKTLGFSSKFLEPFLLFLIVISIVIGLRTVGVILMSAFLVAPPAAARQWTKSLAPMLMLSTFFGALAGFGGAVISSLQGRLPTGPTIVLVLTVIVIFSFLFSPRRGLLSALRMRLKNRTKFLSERILLGLLRLGEKHDSFDHGHPLGTLTVSVAALPQLKRGAKYLLKESFVSIEGAGTLTLTQKGIDRARELKKSVRRRGGIQWLGKI